MLDDAFFSTNHHTANHIVEFELPNQRIEILRYRNANCRQNIRCVHNYHAHSFTKDIL